MTTEHSPQLKPTKPLTEYPLVNNVHGLEHIDKLPLLEQKIQSW